MLEIVFESAQIQETPLYVTHKVTTLTYQLVSYENVAHCKIQNNEDSFGLSKLIDFRRNRILLRCKLRVILLTISEGENFLIAEEEKNYAAKE